MTTTYYCRNQNTDTNCEGGSPLGGYRDLATSSPATEGSIVVDVAGITTFTDAVLIDTDVSGDNPSTGSHTLNVSIINVRNADIQARVEEIAAPSGCSVLNFSVWSATYSAAGTMTDSLSLTWSTGTRLRLLIQGKEQTGSMGQRAFEIALDSSGASYVVAPWEPAVGFVSLPLLGVGW